MVTIKTSGLSAVLIAAALLAPACRQDMHDQPKFKPLMANDFFADGMASRGAVEGTVARGHLTTDDHLFQGKIGSEPATAFPFPIAKADVERGRERFNIYCAPCHGELGDGEGMVVKRGFRHPPSFHAASVRDAPVGHYFDVVTNGFGAMPSYASRIAVNDRWAIIAYVRALQLSQNAKLEDLRPDERTKLGAPQ